MTTELRKKHDLYMDQFSGERITEYKCPDCKTNIRALKPFDDAVNEVWDTMTQCPDCLESHFRSVTGDGVVTIS